MQERTRLSMFKEVYFTTTTADISCISSISSISSWSDFERG